MKIRGDQNARSLKFYYSNFKSCNNKSSRIFGSERTQFWNLLSHNVHLQNDENKRWPKREILEILLYQLIGFVHMSLEKPEISVRQSASQALSKSQLTLRGCLMSHWDLSILSGHVDKALWVVFTQHCKALHIAPPRPKTTHLLLLLWPSGRSGPCSLVSTMSTIVSAILGFRGFRRFLCFDFASYFLN